MAALYIVGTPIGNLEDITLRALRVLKEVDLIAAEDTRHTGILLNKYSIKKPLTSYHKFNIKEKTEHLVSTVRSGKSVALVSDAGMPGISDPGYELIVEALKKGVEVVPVPNTSALLVALSASGINTDRFVFEGFLPVKTGDRKKRLERLKTEERTIVFYEAPHRLIKTLTDLQSAIGDRNICVARELTKKFEEFSRGSISDQISKFSKSKPKGEFVVVVEGGQGEPKRDTGDANILMAELLKAGISQKDTVKIVSNYTKIPKNKLYKLALNL
ncbi:16S rRNA (cytidine(1402)-2'-O)-methyltransferase [Candidatus Margulisiibacteriota bacterium]